MQLVTQRGKAFEYVDVQSGRELFSVSQVRRVMHDSMAGVDPVILEAARVRGSALHRRFWKVMASRLALCPVPPILEEYEGYCRAMDTWAEKNEVEAVRLEEPGMNPKRGYAGCGDIQCRYSRKRILTLGDLKTGVPTKTDPAQLLAYDEMDGYKSEALLDLYVHADGTYDEEWVDKKDKLHQWPWFLSALGVLTGRRNHGIKQ